MIEVSHAPGNRKNLQLGDRSGQPSTLPEARRNYWIRRKETGNSTGELTVIPATVAGLKCQCLIARNAAWSSKTWPELSFTAKVSTVPCEFKSALSSTVPCCPIFRASTG